MSERLEKLREKLNQHKLDALIVSRIQNQKYLAGFAGHADFDSILLISKHNVRVATDGRYWEKAEQDAPGFQLVKLKPEYEQPQAIADFARENDAHTIGFEAQHVPFAHVRDWSKAARKGHFKFRPTDELVERLRA